MDEVTRITVFVLLFTWMLPVVLLLLRRWPRVRKTVQYLALCAYIGANLYETILFRKPTKKYRAKWTPFWSYREAFDGGFKELLTGQLTVAKPYLFQQMVLNVLLYVPLGYLLPFLWPNLVRGKDGRFRVWRVVLIGFLCSAMTEAAQLAFHIGLFEFDDMIHNTAGCLLGCVLYCLVSRLMEHGRKQRGERRP